MSVERRIRWRFEGESPSSVIKGFIKFGYGKLATAQIMGINPRTLGKLTSRYGLQFRPYIELNSSCKAPGRKPRERGQQ